MNFLVLRKRDSTMLRLNRTSVDRGGGRDRRFSVRADRGCGTARIGTTNARAPRVGFTDDGKLTQPVGYRKRMYIGTPLEPWSIKGEDCETF